MDGSRKNNKAYTVFWLKEPIENLKIRVKVKTHDGVTTLPTLEDYRDKSDEENLDKLAEDNITEHTFSWQEKIFSLWEIQKYSEEHNCISETELNYYDIIKDLAYDQKKIFTYVHSDCLSLPLPFDIKKFNKSNVSYLNICLENMNLGNRVLGMKGDSNSMRHLFKSEENIEENERWSIMQIVLDCSQYNEDSKPVFIEEHILLSLYHNVHHNYVVMTPDVNDIETNSYHINGVIGFEYGVELDLNGESGEDMTMLLKHLLSKWEKKHRKLVSFALPQLGQKRFYLSFEIVSATEFDMDSIYIEYHVKIPDNLKHAGELGGRTHCCKFIKNNSRKFWRFGHRLELEIECATGIDPQPLKIYLEAISVDWWGRHRTEGYSCLALTLQPGSYKDRLSCSRPEEIDHVLADTRRFFIGGCNLIKDLNVLDNPQIKDLSFRYTSTGTTSVRWNIISQTPAPSHLPPNRHSSSSSALLRGAEAVLRQYKKAKATLAIATGLAMDGSGDG